MPRGLPEECLSSALSLCVTFRISAETSIETKSTRLRKMLAGDASGMLDMTKSAKFRASGLGDQEIKRN